MPTDYHVSAGASPQRPSGSLLNPAYLLGPKFYRPKVHDDSLHSVELHTMADHMVDLISLVQDTTKIALQARTTSHLGYRRFEAVESKFDTVQNKVDTMQNMLGQIINHLAASNNKFESTVNLMDNEKPSEPEDLIKYTESESDEVIHVEVNKINRLARKVLKTRKDLERQSSQNAAKFAQQQKQLQSEREEALTTAHKMKNENIVKQRKPPIYCLKCKELGHLFEDCQSKDQKLFYYDCGHENVIARECRSKYCRTLPKN